MLLNLFVYLVVSQIRRSLMRSLLFIGGGIGWHFFITQWGYPNDAFTHACHVATCCAAALIVLTLADYIAVRLRTVVRC